MGANGPVYNQGVNGFHLFTVVTDGYGNYITEDMHGGEIAKVKSTGEDNAAAARDLAKLTLATLRAMDPEGQAGLVPTEDEMKL